MPTLRKWPLAFAASAILALIIAACGGGEEATATPRPTTPPGQPTATPPPAATPTRPPAATPTAAPPAATPTRPAATPTPLPTPTPFTGGPTPVVRQPTKRGGTLQLRVLDTSNLITWDPYDVGNTVEFHSLGPMHNNLIWPDPYGKELTGDIAQTWDLSRDGKVITFKLRQGIKFHDGSPLTSKDVLYNIERGWKPRDQRMTQFRVRFSSIEKLEAPDDLTFVITLKTASNVFMQNLSHPGVLMYPAHFPFPEKKDDWKKAPIGSGPFKPTKLDPATKLEYIRYDGYFKTGMPYVDALSFTAMSNENTVAAFRAGRLDATNLDSTPTINQLPELRRAHGWVPIRTIVSIPHVTLNQKPPFTDARVREAVHLAMDRQAVVDIWFRGEGDRRSASMIPPEFGGRWGIPSEELGRRPGYGEDKTRDLARARELLREAGVDPSKFTLTVIGNITFPQFHEVVDSGLRSLGFKTNIQVPRAATEILLRGDYDVNALTPTLTLDDPNDRLASDVTTNGSFNYGKWSVPKLDQLLAEQDSVLDPARRRAMIVEAQEIVLKEAFYIPLALRYGYHGHMPYVKNYPANLQFLFGPLFRWEQVWMEK